MLKIKSTKKFFFSIYIFLIIFCPPITPRFDIVLTVCSATALFLRYRKTFIQAIYKSKISSWIFLMVLLAVYMIIVPLSLSAFVFDDIVQLGHYVSLFNRYGFITVNIAICGTYLFLELKQNGYGLEDFLKFTFFAGAIESLFCVLSMLFPQFKEVLIQIMYKNTGNESYMNLWYTTVRAYGFANTLVDLFGLGVSIIASSCFVYGVFKEKKYILLSFFIIIAAALNARTGLVLYIICVVVTTLYMILKGNIRAFFIGVISVVLSIVIFSFLMKSNIIDETTKDWITKGIESFTQLLQGGNTQEDSMEILFQESWWQLPKGLRLVLGTGHSRYLAKGYSHTDVGYVNELWMFGILGTTFLYFMIIKLIYGAVKANKNTLTACIGFILICNYFTFNIKGVALGYNPGASAMLLIIFAIYYFSKGKNSG